MFQRINDALARRHHVRAQVWQSLAGYTQTIGGMVMGVVLARLLSPDVFGQLAFIISTITLFMIPFTVHATQRLVTDGGRTPDLFGKILGLAILAMSLKFAVLCCIVCWYLLNSSGQDAIVAALVGLPVVFADLLNILRADLEGHGNFRPNFTVQLIGVATHGAVAVVLVLLGWGIYGLAIGGLVGFLPQLYLYWKPSGRRLSAPLISIESLVSQLRVSWWLWLTTACGTALLRIDKIALGMFSGDEQLGYYNRAFNYAPVAALAMGSLMTNASVVALKVQNDGSKRARQLGKISILLASGSLINAAILHFFSDPLVVWIFGEHWRDAIPTFQAFAWLSLAYALYSVPATFLLTLEDFRSLALGRLIGVFSFVALLSWPAACQNHLSTEGVAYSLCAALAFSGVIMAVVHVLNPQKAIKRH